MKVTIFAIMTITIILLLHYAEAEDKRSDKDSTKSEIAESEGRIANTGDMSNSSTVSGANPNANRREKARRPDKGEPKRRPGKPVAAPQADNAIRNQMKATTTSANNGTMQATTPPPQNGSAESNQTKEAAPPSTEPGNGNQSAETPAEPPTPGTGGEAAPPQAAPPLDNVPDAEAQRMLAEMVRMADRLPTLRTPTQMEDLMRVLESLMMSALESMSLTADVGGGVTLSDGPLVLGQGLGRDICRRDALQIFDRTCRDPGLALDAVLRNGRRLHRRFDDLFRRRRQQLVAVVQRNVVVRTLVQSITAFQIVDRGRRVNVDRRRRRPPVQVVERPRRNLGGVGAIPVVVQHPVGVHVPIVGAGPGLLDALHQQGVGVQTHLKKEPIVVQRRDAKAPPRDA